MSSFTATSATLLSGFASRSQQLYSNAYGNLLIIFAAAAVVVVVVVVGLKKKLSFHIINRLILKILFLSFLIAIQISRDEYDNVNSAMQCSD